jgi:hypothetical protein
MAPLPSMSKISEVAAPPVRELSVTFELMSSSVIVLLFAAAELLTFFQFTLFVPFYVISVRALPP